MTTQTAMPDVLARPLSYAMKLLHAQGWETQIVRAKPFFHSTTQVWRDADAYVLKQSRAADNIIQLIVGCKFERRCTDYGTQD